MSAEILAFPRPALRAARLQGPAPSLADLLRRKADPSLSYFEREQIAVCIDMHRAAGHFLTLPTEPDRREAGITAGAQALEGSLFHALCMKGCPNEDRELMQLLVRRQARRDQADG